MAKQYIISVNGEEVKASKYQNEIYENLEFGTGSMIVDAAAGAAKTTTMVNALRIDNICDGKKVLFIAFNTSIVDAIKEKVGTKDNIDIKTFHSLGFSMLRNVFKEIDFEIDENKYTRYIMEIYRHFVDKNVLKDERKITEYRHNIEKLVDYCRYYVTTNQREYKKIAEKYGLVLLHNETEVVREVLIWGKNNIKTIDYTDMIWLPNMLNLTSKKLLYDFVFIDEAQDTSIAEQKLVEKTFKRNTRFVCVCDSHQQINIWCGATEDAINNFRNLNPKNCKDFQLPISYRCPKKVVELAKKYSDNIIAADNAIEGEINTGVNIYAPVDGDMVLSRTTAPLVDLFLKFLRVNKKAYIKGAEQEAETLIGIIENSKATIIDKDCTTKDGLFPYLYKIFLSIVENNKRVYTVNEEEAMRYNNALRFYDIIETISVFCEGVQSIDGLKEKIKTILSGKEEGVELLTIHKAKGLEADNIFILCPSILFESKAKVKWEIESERNLKYVAFTRAKKTLNFMEEERTFNHKLYHSYSTREMKRYIDIVRKQLEFNEKHDIKESDIATTEPAKIVKIGETKPTKNVGFMKLKGFLKK